MSPVHRRWSQIAAQAVCLGLALLALSAAPGTAASAGGSSCGVVAVRINARAYYYWSMNRVQASGVACAPARGLVRDWAVAAAAGRIPGRVVLATNARGVLVYGRFGAPYGFEGYTCRWMNVNPGRHYSGFQPGDGRCSSGGAVISWSFHSASNPTLAHVRGCPGIIARGPAQATTIRARAMTCAGAKRIIRYVLAHHLIRPARYRGLRLVRSRALGFRLSHRGLEFRARRGQSQVSFVVYWIDCGC